MMISVFSLMLNSAVMAEEYDYTVFRDVDGVPVAVDNPQSCSTLFDIGQGEDITMTPVYRRVCETGYYDKGGLVSLEDISSNPDTCVLIAKNCDPGEYLDFSGNEPICKECPVGYWCPSRYLSVQTVNDTVCGGVNNVAEGGMTEENKNYKWKNNQCIDSETNQVVVGVTSESECGFTSIGKCKCPGDTTTRATKQEGFGLHSTSIDACAYYDLEPGEQLKRSVDTEHNYQWENGKCIDKDTNEEVTSIKSSVYCGYTYTKETCDADNFCLGGVFTAAKYMNSMNACPDKYNDVATLETSSDCAVANTNGFAWNATHKKCFIAGTSIEVKNITTSGACTKANEIKADLVWNTEKQACLLKGHSDTGSFRCSYTCPAGYYMRVVNQYDNDFHSRSVQSYYTSDYFLGGWRAFYTTCEPCPVGSYCLLKTYFLDELHNDTKYHADTYYDKNDASKQEQIKYYTNNKSFGITNCNDYKANSTTVDMGSYEASQCKSYCPAGQYYSKAAGECVLCQNAGLADDAYCPGGVLYAEHPSEDVGVSTCKQQNVMLYQSGINNVHDTVYIAADDNTKNHYIQPTEDRTACACPAGYKWNKTTHACCEPNKACCGAGLDLRTYSDNSYECKPCGSGNSEEDAACDLICDVNGEQSSDCTACRSKAWCPGTVLIIDTPCVLKTNQYRGRDDGCYTCGAGSVPSDYNENKHEYTSCECTLAQMTTDMNAGNSEDRFPELKDEPNPGLVRHWNGSVCELDTYYVGVRYTNIDLNGSVYEHGTSCSWYLGCDYWHQYYKYGQIRNKNGNYVAGDSFVVDWNPSETGYNFSNPVTPEEGLANPESMSARKVKDGYVFAGWCREADFCCPAGYKVQDLEGGKQECVICPNGDKTSETCNGSKWLAPDTKPVIYTKAEENRIAPESFKYHAMMVADTVCAKGQTLNTATVPVACMDCPVGHYCLGGKLSPRKLEKYTCPKGTYREYTKGTQEKYSYDPEHPDTYDGCKPCSVGVSEELSRIAETDVQVPTVNGLTTQQSASTSVDQCGYYCEEKFYDAADNRFMCDVPCPAGYYCPADGPEPGYTKYRTKFFDWEVQGEGSLECPSGLSSDAGARQCYTDPGCTTKHYKWENDECIDEDTGVAVLVPESDCVYTGYYKKKDTVTGAYVCVKCGANDPLTDSYFYCPGFDKLNIDLVDYKTIHKDFGGRYTCEENPVTHIKRISDDNADHCYELPNAGRYTDPETGLPEPCNENFFCTGKEENGVLGRQRCPYGSVSSIGAQFITDCHCVSGENYRPDGVYYEKGAELVQYGSTLNDFACVNTYLVVDNTASYESAEDSISNAKAKVVSCAWVNTQEHPDENAAPDGKYSNCTEKAVDICYKSIWNNTVVGSNVSAGDSSYVPTADVLTWLAGALYTNTDQQTIQHLMSKLSRVSNVKNIPTVDNWQSCQKSNLCIDSFSHYDDVIGICYAEITYKGVDDEDITWPEDPENPGEYLLNPTQYTPDMLPFILYNPEKPHHVFNGWCLAGESKTDCLANTIQLAFDEDADDFVTFVERVIPKGTVGDLEFTAQWEMVCPDDYSHHDGELTDVTQCYAEVEFDSNKSGIPNPENHIEHYSEGATVYTLATLPELPSVTGYNFGGWYDNAAMTGNAVTTETALSGDNKLYAKWSSITYSVAFDGNGATRGSMADETFAYDESKALSANAFEKTGWNFVGWCKGATACNTTDANFYVNEAVVSNLTSSDNATITMYAKWTPKTYTVKFDGNGADANSGPMADETFEYGERKALFANEFEKTDYDFVGWCKGVTVCNDTDVNFYTDEEEVSVSNLVSVDATENTVTMYAQWQAIGCSPEFPLKDATTGACYANIVYKNTEGATWVNSHNQVITTNPDPQRYNALDLPITLSKPRKDNYVFLGWCENEEMTENCELEKTIALGSTGHKTFWAKWEHSCISHKYLHIGDTAICLYTEKPTSPALAIKIDGTVYYGHMCKNCSKTMNGETESKLHIRYDEETYNVYDLTAQ